MAKIRIMSDSTADIPRDLQKELDITVLPLTIIDGDKEYLDDVTITTKEFYQILEECEKLPSSSRVGMGLFTEQYEKAWKEGYSDLIYICLNSKGSSTYQGAVLELNDFYEENPEAKNALNVHIVDSLTYSMGYGWATVMAAKMAKEGKEVDEILLEVKDWLENNKILFVPMNLKFVKKSGRVSAAAAFVGDALGLKPVITFDDGESHVISKIRGEKKLAKNLVDMVEAEIKPGTPYILAAGNNAEMYEKLKAEATARLGEPAAEFNLGCIITINTGPNAVGIIYRK
ncbi:MAG: DegV family protein [Clostridia bacterium]|nr:DegV family protein [Clostridia bacterium]